jgi:hypothetical protein
MPIGCVVRWRKGQTSSSHESIASYRSALRRVLQYVPNVRAAAAAAAPLEHLPADAEPPHVMDAEVIEDATLRARAVPGAPTPAFAAFLDGAQRSRVLGWYGPAPIVFGSAGAVVRERSERRLVTWGSPLILHRVYAPLAFAPAEPLRKAFPESALVDTAPPDPEGTLPDRHPTLLLERARLAVSRDRELAELRLAEQWCTARTDPILIDGGIGVNDIVARSPAAVGVVKTHRTLYAAGSALDTVLALRRGERSSVMRITPHGRNAVDSWYLRLRDPISPLWGLVRIEVASAPGSPTVRADTVSRWVLAETAPVALPDPRWDTMTYGIRSCEELLRALAISSP